MMKLSNSMKKFFAYVCAIAMVVSSMTFYGQTSVKAKGSVAVDGKVYTVTDGDATIAGFTCQGIFDKARIHFAWGTEVDAASITTTVNGKSVKIDGTNAHGMFIPLSEVSTLAVGEYQIVVSATATENSATVTGNATLKIEDEGETTTRDPSVKVWIDLGDGFSYDDSTTATVNNIQQPDWSPEKGIYVNVPAGISSVAVNGKTGDEVTKIQGAGVIVFLSAMTKKTNTVEIEYAGGKATVIVKNENGTDGGDTPIETPTEKPTETPTEKPTETPTEKPTETPTTQPTGEANWVEIAGSDDTASYYYDKANMTVNEVVSIQQPGWSPAMGIYMNVPSGISEVSVNGVKENVATIQGAGVIVYLSALTQEINEVEITHALGTAKVSIKKVEKAQTVKHSVTINGNKVAEVEDGSTYTLGDAQYGYYTDGKIYKPGTVLTITGDIALTSIDSLSVDMANGAAIKLSTPAGLKFQAKVSSNNGEAVKSDAIKEGMLITANDIYENNSSALDLTSPYAMLNIVNEGWFDESAMTYCGAVANISEANYTRDFIARAYVTITYTDNTSVTVYSGMSQTRSVSYVASAVKAAGYPGIAASEIPVVDSFIK